MCKWIFDLYLSLKSAILLFLINAKFDLKTWSQNCDNWQTPYSMSNAFKSAAVDVGILVTPPPNRRRRVTPSAAFAPSLVSLAKYMKLHASCRTPMTGNANSFCNSNNNYRLINKRKGMWTTSSLLNTAFPAQCLTRYPLSDRFN